MFLAVIVISAVFGCVIFGIIAFCIGRCLVSAFSDGEEAYIEQEQLPNESLDQAPRNLGRRD